MTNESVAKAPKSTAPSAPGEALQARETRLFSLDGKPVAFTSGQTILEAATAAGRYIPHLCAHPDFPPHSSCKLCVVKANGRYLSACSTRAREGLEVESNTPELNGRRRTLLQMIFVEGNHYCPGCEKSGFCDLQALAYQLEMQNPHFSHFWPDRTVDASHPDVFIDFNRCIFCELCVRASRDVDGKHIFALTGRGIKKHLCINSRTGKLGDTDFSAADRAANICPVGAILKKHVGFSTPIGKRTYDATPISVVSLASLEASK
ncbi:MAG: 2Fe-2S iron-sulfur cluster-binding protein [Betaproteobacteria bacterium]|nr:2Fe-2S iron-sulfur cluster-binding protein [Betaproteobacteria bacterium]